MSKNIRKNSKTAPANTAMADAIENAKDAAKIRQDHAFTDSPATSDNALVGTQPSTGAQVSGNTLFDEVFNLSSVGQVQVLRSIANGALYAAIMAAHTRVSWDGPTEDTGLLTTQDIKRLEYFESLPSRINQQRSLYEYAAKELLPLATTDFDKPMDFETMFTFVASNASRQNDADELPDEVLEALHITRAQLRLIDADEAKKQAKRDEELRASIKEHKSAIRAEVGALLVEDGNDEVLSTLTPQQHAALLQKAAKKLQDRVGQLLAIRARYEGALGEAMLIGNDARTIDKAYAAFVRRNSSELREAA